MIIIDRLELTILTPPKCGSTSAHDRWTKDDVGGIWVIGPQADGRVDKHTMELPYQSLDHRIVCLTRNPVDRFLSLLNHARKFDDASVTIDAFIGVVLRRQNLFALPITEILDTTIVDEWWSIESIDDVATAHGLPQLPRLNQSKSGSLSSDQRERLMPWIEADMV